MRDMKTVETSDTDAAAFLAASGYALLHVRATERRAAFVFRDSRRASGSRALFEFYQSAHLRRMLAQRKILRRAVDLARSSPSKTCTAADLDAHLAAWAPRQEQHHHEAAR